MGKQREMLRRATAYQKLVTVLLRERANAMLAERNSLDKMVKATHGEYLGKFEALLCELGEL